MSILEFVGVAAWVTITVASLASMWRGRRELFAPPSPPAALTGIEITTHHYYDDDHDQHTHTTEDPRAKQDDSND